MNPLRTLLSIFPDPLHAFMSQGRNYVYISEGPHLENRQPFHDYLWHPAISTTLTRAPNQPGAKNYHPFTGDRRSSKPSAEPVFWSSPAWFVLLECRKNLGLRQLEKIVMLRHLKVYHWHPLISIFEACFYVLFFFNGGRMGLPDSGTCKSEGPVLWMVGFWYESRSTLDPLGFRVYTNVQTQFILGCPYFHGHPWPHSNCLCFLSSNVLRDAWICCRILLGFPPTPWNPIPKKAEFPSELSCSILTIRYQNIVVQIVIYIYIWLLCV